MLPSEQNNIFLFVTSKPLSKSIHKLTLIKLIKYISKGAFVGFTTLQPTTYLPTYLPTPLVVKHKQKIGVNDVADVAISSAKSQNECQVCGITVD